MLALVCAALALPAAGCGSASPPLQDRSVSLVLDFTPNAVHGGIFTAHARGFDDGEGVRLHIRVPGQSTDSVRELVTGKVDFAVLDIHDLALAAARGRPIVGIMALVQTPLAALIAQPAITTPRKLEGERAGVTGLPSDVAVLDSIVRGAGGRPGRVDQVTIGFNAVAALLSRRVAAVTAFWNVEGVTLQSRRPGFHIFKVDQFGAPTYPELVLCASRATLRAEPDTVRATLAAIARGYQLAVEEPSSSVADIVAQNRGLDRGLLDSEMTAVYPYFQAPDGRVGELDPGRLREWAAWEQRFGIVRRAPDVARLFDASFLPR